MRTNILSLSLVLLTSVAVYASDLNAKFIDAAKHGDLDTVKELLNKGVDVNAKDKNERTALMEAAYWGQLDLVKFLLAKGADVNAKDKNGHTALIAASQSGHTQIAQALLAKGVDAQARKPS